MDVSSRNTTNYKELFNKINNITDKTTLLKIAEVVINDNNNYTVNNNGFYFMLTSLKPETINKIKIILTEPIKTDNCKIKETIDWYKILDNIINI